MSRARIITAAGAANPKRFPIKDGKFTYTEWKAYWNALTEDERQSLRDKANWEHMTLSAVASEWGAVAKREAGKP